MRTVDIKDVKRAFLGKCDLSEEELQLIVDEIPSTEVKELITEFIVDKSVEIVHYIELKDADAISEEVENWLSEDCHSADD